MGGSSDPVVKGVDRLEPFEGQDSVAPMTNKDRNAHSGAENIEHSQYQDRMLDADGFAPLRRASELSAQKENTAVSQFGQDPHGPHGEETVEKPFELEDSEGMTQARGISIGDLEQELNSIVEEMFVYDSAIEYMGRMLSPLGNYPLGEYYQHFAQMLIIEDASAISEGKYWLGEMLDARERHHTTLNKIMAMTAEPLRRHYTLRIWDVNARSSLIAAVEILEEAEIELMREVETLYWGREGPPLFESAGDNRRIEIIDPSTGQPIVIGSDNGLEGEEAFSADGKAASIDDGTDQSVLRQVPSSEDIDSGSVYEGTVASDRAIDGSISDDTDNAGTCSGDENGPATVGVAEEPSSALVAEGIEWVPPETWTAPLNRVTEPRASETLPRNFPLQRGAVSSDSFGEQQDVSLEETSSQAVAGRSEAFIRSANQAPDL